MDDKKSINMIIRMIHNFLAHLPRTVILAIAILSVYFSISWKHLTFWSILGANWN